MTLGGFSVFDIWPWLVGGGIIVGLLWLADQLFAPISTLPYGLIGFFGNRGRGKTFTMVAYARRWRRAHPHSHVYTNLDKLNLPGDKDKVHLSCTMDDITQARDCLVVIDEAGVFLNAWNYVATNQRRTARWIAGTRHYGVMVLMTAHLPDHINKRIRDVLDEMYFMESFQGLKVFRAKVYESSAGVKQNKPTKTVWIPKLPTICNAYNTNSLRERADAEGVDVVGVDEMLLGPDGKVARSSTRNANNRIVADKENNSSDSGYTGPSEEEAYTEEAPTDWPKRSRRKTLAEIDRNYTKNKQAKEAETEVVNTGDESISEPTENNIPITDGVEVMFRPGVATEDLAYVKRMVEWFESMGGKVYEITVPNLRVIKNTLPPSSQNTGDILSEEEFSAEVEKAEEEIAREELQKV